VNSCIHFGAAAVELKRTEVRVPGRRFDRVAPAFIPLLLLTLLVTMDARAGTPLSIGPQHELFLDDHLIASMTRVRRTVEQAQKFPGNPVLWPREKWEPPMATVYGSVIQDGNKFKMWYKSGMSVAYAESDDGIAWSKPRLDLTMIDGERSNILFAKKSKTEGPESFPYFYELFGVHRDDRDPDPARRYKMGFLCIDWKYKGTDGDPWHKGQRRGLGVAASADGLHWKLINSWATESIVDGATHWMWDTARERWILYGRTRKALPEVAESWKTNDWFKNWFSGRAVARVESRDFVSWDFTSPDTAPVALTADLQDKPGTEIYSMKVFPYEGLYIGLVQVFHATPDDSTLDVQLAVSRDSVHFTRVGDRGTFIPLGAVGSWDRFNLSLANNDPIGVGDELRFYYGGRMYRHGPYAGPDKGPEKSGIGFATIQRDRFVALEASFDGGEIVTKPVRLKGSGLRLNAKADFGEIIVEVLNPAGKIIASSKAVQRDGLNLPVEWSDEFKTSSNAVTLRLKLKNARLYALWCEP
jgi:hypothetical protein